MAIRTHLFHIHYSKYDKYEIFTDIESGNIQEAKDSGG